MQCTRCKSSRIQRDFDDTGIARLVGIHKLLCNNCGLIFNGFDPLGTFRSAAADERNNLVNRRRGPRYYAHLPAAISLLEENVQTGKASYSEPSRGHCESIGQFGMALSFVGTRFVENDIARVGRLLFVRVNLPEAAIDAVLSIVHCERIGEEGNRRWHVGASIHQMSEQDTARLAAYLATREKSGPVIPT